MEYFLTEKDGIKEIPKEEIFVFLETIESMVHKRGK